MPGKRALIVDDSKSARVVLSRMLQRYDIEVDTAESAEAAIDYLVQNRPDVIFMDHLMPGMDGFQAVQAIKNNPRTATIPIMMYTSQEGELYVGQARALGAVGVLPKLVKPVDVSKILYQLRLLPDRRVSSPPAFVAANEPAQAQLRPQGRVEQRSASGLVPADWPLQLEAALRNHDAELRRFMVASLDTYADRVAGDVRNLIDESPAMQAAPPPPERKPPYLWLAAVAAALVPGIVLAIFYTRALEANRGLATEQHRLDAANMQLESANGQLQAAVDRLTRLDELRASEPPLGASYFFESRQAARTRSRTELVPYGEIPLGAGRLEALRQFLGELDAQSFTGAVRAQMFDGRFCLVGTPSEGYALAPNDLAASRCDLIGNPFADSLSPAQRQSLAFANLASSMRQSAAGAITLEAVKGDERQAAQYPTSAANVTAGEWNEAAARNNRVEFTAAPLP